MRRIFLFLALLAGGFGGWSAEPAAAGPSDPAAGTLPAVWLAAVPPALTPGYADVVPGALRSAAPVVAPVWRGGTGGGPSPARLDPRQAAPAPAFFELALHVVAGCTSFEARSAECRLYASARALERSGRLGFHTTAPPPFRLV